MQRIIKARVKSNESLNVSKVKAYTLSILPIDISK
jgi:hypothetical protein